MIHVEILSNVRYMSSQVSCDPRRGRIEAARKGASCYLVLVVSSHLSCDASIAFTRLKVSIATGRVTTKGGFVLLVSGPSRSLGRDKSPAAPTPQLDLS